ncbi:hydrolase [bacterium]|nr:hydrolase [bacterium]
MNHFLLNKEKAALIIIDVQERLVPAMNQKDPVTANCLHLIEAAKLLDLPVIVTEQYPKGLGQTIKEIRDAVSIYKPMDKTTFDCCKGEGFLQTLSDLDRPQLILAGMETHVCVLQTCLSLLQKGYTIHLVSDAVCSRKKTDYLSAKELMRDAGAVITCTETVLFQLLEKAGTPAFKTISNRIK